jgi:Cof subfamily protein (haloacid dehalogenase superfamily)
VTTPQDPQGPPLHIPGEALPINWRPELICLDIDDTLAKYLGSIAEEAVDAIERIIEAGIKVTLATGRSISTTYPIARAAGIEDLIVCSNGAILAMVETEKVMEAITFDATEAIEQIMVLVPDAVLAVEDTKGHFFTTHPFETGALGLSIQEVELAELTKGPVVRLVVRSESATAESYRAVAKSLGFHSVVFGIDRVAWMDIAPQGVNKANMLKEVCSRRQIDPTKTIAIGDSWNDIEMLDWAGLSVAMGTAVPKVAAHADLITSPEPGIGVAQILNAIQL